MVIALVHQGSGGTTVTLHHLHHIAVEGLLQQPFDQCRGCRCMFRRFDHGGVPCRQGADQWLECEVKGVIPGANDQDTPKGFPNYLGLPRLQGKGDRHLAGTHPAAQQAIAEFQFLPQSQHLHHPFCWWFAQVGVQCIKDVVLMLIKQLAHRLQLLAAPGLCAGFTTSHRCPQTLDIRQAVAVVLCGVSRR